MNTPLKQCSSEELCIHPDREGDGWLPATEQYFYTKKDGRLKAACKKCHGKAAKEQRDPIKAKEYWRKWQKDNPDKRKAIKERFDERNPGRTLEYNREWYARNVEEQRQRVREYKEKNHEKELERTRNYVATHPKENRLMCQRRAARKRNLPDDLTIEQWNYALEYFGHRCVVCGRPEGDGYHLTADHWIPLVSEDCLGTTRFNAIPLCHSITKGAYGACNNSKRSSMPEAWLTKRFGAERAAEILDKVESYFEHLRSLG